MVDEPIIVGIDIGTTKICTLVARVDGERNFRILGVGIEPSQGIKKGTIVDINAAARSISNRSKKRNEHPALKSPPPWSVWQVPTFLPSTAGELWVFPVE